MRNSSFFPVLFDGKCSIHSAAPALHATAAPACSIMQTDPTQDAGPPCVSRSAELRALHPPDVLHNSAKIKPAATEVLVSKRVWLPPHVPLIVIVWSTCVVYFGMPPSLSRLQLSSLGEDALTDVLLPAAVKGSVYKDDGGDLQDCHRSPLLPDGQ